MWGSHVSPYFIFVFKVCNTTTDRNHADPALEKYVTETVMAIVKGFFSSPFSVNHSNLQVLFSTSWQASEMCRRGSLIHSTSKAFANFKIPYIKNENIWQPAFSSSATKPGKILCLCRNLYFKPLLEVFYTEVCANISYQRQCWSVPIRILSLITVLPPPRKNYMSALSPVFYRRTNLSSSSCSSLLSGSTAAPGSTHCRRLTLRAASKHLLTLVSVAALLSSLWIWVLTQQRNTEIHLKYILDILLTNKSNTIEIVLTRDCFFQSLMCKFMLKSMDTSAIEASALYSMQPL